MASPDIKKGPSQEVLKKNPGCIAALVITLAKMLVGQDPVVAREIREMEETIRNGE